MAANIQHSSNSQEWYTPARYIELVRQVLGTINLDPASSAEANQVVGAINYYDKENTGLDRGGWWGKIYLNPPYGQGVTIQWVNKLLAEYKAGRVKEAILLVNNATGTKWFHLLWPFTICFVRGRIRFDQPAGTVKGQGPSHAQVFVYLGPDPARFRAVFSQIGHIVGP